ncbi:MAG: hypothetical protein AAGG08_00670 [Actinomycetota bacterium]
MNTKHHPRTLLTGLAAAALVVAACGSDDDADDTTDASSDTETVADEPTASGDGDGSEVLADNEVRDDVIDAVDPDGQLDDAIGGLSAETRYDIVAGQIGDPEIEINGDDIRLVYDSGSVDDAFGNCIVASVTQLETETVTLVYPDGEEVC